MAVSTNSAACDWGVMVSVSGTDAEVIAELAAATDITAAYALQNPNNIIASGGNATAFTVVYIHKD